MSNSIITRLRNQYLDLVNREADWSERYGKNHTAVVNLRNQIRDIRRSIADELGRIEETFKSEYEIAKKRQDELEKGLAGLVSQSTETNQAQVALFSLEAAAQSYRKIYDNFLQQHTESIQQQTFPITEARQTSAGVRNQNCAETIASLDGGDICRRDARGRTWSLAGNQGPRVPDQGTGAICSCDRVPCAGPVANR